MTTLREAAEAAIEALKYAMEHMQCDEHGNGPDCAPVLQARINLSAALAVQPQAEPVAEVGPCFSLVWAGQEPVATLLARHPGVRIGSKLYAAPPAPAHEADAGEARDAARYRKWREEFAGAPDEEAGSMLHALNDAWTPDAVDAAIDAALSQPAPKEPQ